MAFATLFTLELALGVVDFFSATPLGANLGWIFGGVISLGAILTYEENFFLGITWPGDNFSSDALRFSCALDLFFGLGSAAGAMPFCGDLLFCLTDSCALGVDERNGATSVSLFSSSDLSNS